MVCQCKAYRRVAVFAKKVLPKVNRQVGNYAAQVATVTTRGVGLPVMAAAVLLFVTLGLVAWHFDRSTLYTATPPRSFLPTTVGQLLALHVRFYMSVVRPFYIVPGYVPYTRLQVLTLFTIAVELNACCALLFAGVDQCNPARAFTAAAFSTVLSSFATLMGRVAFKKASKGGEVGRFLKHSKRHRNQVRHL